MDFCKLLLFATLFLFLGSSAHRYERHATKNVTLDGLVDDTSETNGTNYDRLPEVLSADVRTNVQQDGDDLMLTGYGDVKVEVDKNNPELQFELCSSFASPQNCFGKTVTVCYHAENVIDSARGSCGSHQCEFIAGVSERSRFRNLWFMLRDLDMPFAIDEGIVCISAVMKDKQAIAPFLDKPFESCQPKFYDGNMVKLSVTGFMGGCYLKVKNAKQWFPTTTSLPTTPEMPSTVPSPSETTESSRANTDWIIVGIFAGIVVLVIIGLIILYCFCYKKKKSTVARTIEGRVVEPLPELGELKTITEAEKLTVEDEDAGAKRKTTEEKKEIEPVKPEVPKEVQPPPKPAKKKKKEKKVAAAIAAVPPPPKEEEKQPPKPAKVEVKEEKVVVKDVPKPATMEVKEDPKPATMDKHEEEQKEDKTQEEPVEVKEVFVKASIEDGTIDTVIAKQPVPLDHYPFVLVPPDTIHPFSSELARSQYKGSLRRGKRNSLSEDPLMCLVVEAESRIIKKIGFRKLDKATKVKLEAEMDKFFPNVSSCSLDPRETILFCCPMNAMLPKVEKLVDAAEEALTEFGCEYDKLGCMIEASDGAKEFLAKPSTPFFIRSYAFGGIHRDYIDPFVGKKQVHSIPLLFAIAMQRRYSAPNRLQALTFIRKQLPIVKNHYTADRCRGFPFPVNAIEDAFKLNPAGFKLQEEDPTQASKTRTSKKLSKKKPAPPKRKLIEW